MSNPYNFNTNSQPNLAASAPTINFAQDLAPLMKVAGGPTAPAAPATKQSVSTNPQAVQQQQNQTAAQNLGAAIGKWMQQYNQQAQRYGAPAPGAPLQPQQSVAPVNNPGSPFNVTGGLY